MNLFICIPDMKCTTCLKIKFTHLVPKINYTLRSFSKIKINQLTFLINSQISEQFGLFLFQSNFIYIQKTKIVLKEREFCENMKINQ